MSSRRSIDLVKVASEIVLRIYLTIGFVALIGLIALAATSTDGMIKRLGGARWNSAAQAGLPDRDPRRHPFPDADQARHLRVGDGRGLPVLAARLPAAAPLCRRRRVCFPDRVSRSSRSALTAFAEAAWYGVTHRRHVAARALRQSRLGYLEPDVPPRAMGADCRARHARSRRSFGRCGLSAEKARKTSPRAADRAQPKSNPAADGETTWLGAWYSALYRDFAPSGAAAKSKCRL